MTGRDEVQRARFDDLTPRQLHDILRLRSEVFVVEQDCVFLDIDGRDHEPTTEHLWTEDDRGVAGVARVLHEHDDVWSIGRVVARPDVRSTGVAGRLMSVAIEVVEEAGAATTLLKAQSHLAGWYGRFGFAVDGDEFVEDGIPHVPMSRRAPARTETP